MLLSSFRPVVLFSAVADAAAAGAAAVEDLGVLLDAALGSDGDDDGDEGLLCMPVCEADGIGVAAMRTRCRLGGRGLLLLVEETAALAGVLVALEAGDEADAEAGVDGRGVAGFRGLLGECESAVEALEVRCAAV